MDRKFPHFFGYTLRVRRTLVKAKSTYTGIPEGFKSAGAFRQIGLDNIYLKRNTILTSDSPATAHPRECSSRVRLVWNRGQAFLQQDLQQKYDPLRNNLKLFER